MPHHGVWAGFFFGFFSVVDERRGRTARTNGDISADRLVKAIKRGAGGGGGKRQAKGPGSFCFSATDETVLRDESSVKECGAATHTAVRFLFLVSWAVF